jgi:hypothetical protein
MLLRSLFGAGQVEGCSDQSRGSPGNRRATSSTFVPSGLDGDFTRWRWTSKHLKWSGQLTLPTDDAADGLFQGVEVPGFTDADP